MNNKYDISIEFFVKFLYEIVIVPLMSKEKGEQESHADQKSLMDWLHLVLI